MWFTPYRYGAYIPMTTYDYFAFVVYLILFFGYQYTYFFFSHKLRKNTREYKINSFREHWMDLIIERKEPILAIQTIRNLTMANTFLMSLVMIMMGGLFSVMFAHAEFAETVGKIQDLNAETLLNYANDNPAHIKISLGIFMLLLSGYNFTITIRILYNLNFTASSALKKSEEREFQYEQLRRQARHFITGIRSLYYFFGPMLWLLDTTAMIAFTIVTTIAFFRFDFISKSDDMPS